jgi:uncharacterized Tic20 family protein
MSENNDVYAKPMNLTPENERLFAILSHAIGIPFEFFGPLVAFLIFNGKGPFITHHVKESLNFGITMILWFIVLAVSIVGWLIIWAVPFVYVILRIVAAVQASQGVFYKYPLTIRFIK